MSSPLSVIMFVVVRGSSIFLVKDEKGEWNFPKGNLDLKTARIAVVRGLARITLDPFFTELVICSVEPFMPAIEDLTINDERAGVTVFKCEITGTILPEKESKVWFADLSNLPAHAVSSDIRGIVEKLATNIRFL